MARPLFTKLLIANRGEIAVRIIRACRELGVRTVAVYSEADANARHVRLADEAVAIGPPPPNESYLCSERIIDAAKQSSAEAIHPGYGFLSENADFAQAVADAGLVFIGPPPAAMRAMGDKSQARTLMAAAGVSIVPGYQGADDDAAMQAAARDLRYPVLIKAAHGGGGRGMRRVLSPDELADSLAAARREARGAFGAERLVLERYVQNTRHIEFQIFGDRRGAFIHLFERECSIQRRHQKIIEETPSPLLDDALRDVMGAAAVAAARAVGYENAGTVEFIVDPDTRAFFFLEMNARLQVEHPVTEMTTGVDLVQWQLRVAAGEPLPLTQDGVTRRGHAIECRVCAEDPSNQFLPAVGRLLKVVEPQAPGVRVDSGFVTGDEVTMHYDPLLAKVIAFAESRGAALRKMRSALRDYVVLGVSTNLEFLQAVLAHEEFQSGRATTSFVEQHLADWAANERAVPDAALIAAALAELEAAAVAEAAPAGTSDPFSPWRHAGGFRIGGRP